MGKKLFAAITGVISLIYLINPSAGILELIPDNIPLLGNLDEAAATALLLSSLRYFGADFTNLLGSKKDKNSEQKKIKGE
jgi:hypothetical protein